MTPPINKAANTAKPAPSVAVTNPPKIPPRIMIGRVNAQPAFLNLSQTL